MNQKQRILELLASAQPFTVSNAELNETVAFRYSARIFDLRRMGFDIDTLRGNAGLWHFRLITPKRLIDWDRLTVRAEQKELFNPERS